MPNYSTNSECFTYLFKSLIHTLRDLDMNVWVMRP